MNSTAGELRLWPGFVLVALMWAARYGGPVVLPEWSMQAVLGALLCSVLILLWWLLFSRARWMDRIGAIILLLAFLLLTPRILDKSIVGGMMGGMFLLYAAPIATTVLVAWAALGARRAWFVPALALVGGGFASLRTEGISGSASSEFRWRWTPTAEEKLLLSMPAAPVVADVAVPGQAPEILADWPGFRGPARDGVVRGLRINADWKAAPPAVVWRKAIGPGWSSFAAGGGLLFTQEQRGEFEFVSCYRLSDGGPVWAHRDKARFWESNGGAGPRGTPLLHGDRVYALGANGNLNALRARDGVVVWTRNAATDTGATIPEWGFSSSPILIDGVLVIALSGRLVGYDAETGEKKWFTSTGAGSYASPHRLGNSVAILNGRGATAVSSADGKVLWKHEWPENEMGYLQPVPLDDGGYLITRAGAGGGSGLRRIAAPTNGKAEERWTSRGLKPYFSDFVVHKGHAYGFDGSILSCIDLKDGARKWKGGRFGNGQMLLLADQDLLLVTSEDGEVGLVSATPDEFKELARIRVLDDKTWNHPAISGGRLLVRNGVEMVALQLGTIDVGR